VTFLVERSVERTLPRERALHEALLRCGMLGTVPGLPAHTLTLVPTYINVLTEEESERWWLPVALSDGAEEAPR
jgi:hypothetical protein